MANNAVGMDFHEELTCPVCCEPYTTSDGGVKESRVPKVLPTCGHTLCETCLLILADEGKRWCPLCREHHNLDADALKALKSPFTILNIVEKLSYATNVGNNFKLQNDVTDIASVCKDHGQHMIGWCRTCEVSVCVQCIQFRHHSSTEHPILNFDEFKEHVAKGKRKADLFYFAETLPFLRSEVEDLLLSLYDLIVKDLSKEEIEKDNEWRQLNKMEQLFQDFNESYNFNSITKLSEIDSDLQLLSKRTEIMHQQNRLVDNVRTGSVKVTFNSILQRIRNVGYDGGKSVRIGYHDEMLIYGLATKIMNLSKHDNHEEATPTTRTLSPSQVAELETILCMKRFWKKNPPPEEKERFMKIYSPILSAILEDQTSHIILIVLLDVLGSVIYKNCHPVSCNDCRILCEFLHQHVSVVTRLLHSEDSRVRNSVVSFLGKLDNRCKNNETLIKSFITAGIIPILKTLVMSTPGEIVHHVWKTFGNIIKHLEDEQELLEILQLACSSSGLSDVWVIEGLVSFYRRVLCRFQFWLWRLNSKDNVLKGVMDYFLSSFPNLVSCSVQWGDEVIMEKLAECMAEMKFFPDSENDLAYTFVLDVMEKLLDDNLPCHKGMLQIICEVLQWSKKSACLLLEVDAITVLIHHTFDSDAEVRIEAVRTLHLLLADLNAENVAEREEFIQPLSNMKSHMPVIVELMQDAVPEVRSNTVLIIKELTKLYQNSMDVWQSEDTESLYTGLVRQIKEGSKMLTLEQRTQVISSIDAISSFLEISSTMSCTTVNIRWYAFKDAGFLEILNSLLKSSVKCYCVNSNSNSTCVLATIGRLLEKLPTVPFNNTVIGKILLRKSVLLYNIKHTREICQSFERSKVVFLEALDKK